MTLLATKSGEDEDHELATPDITTAQVVAVVQSVVGLLVAFGAPITSEQSAAILQLVTALAVVLPLADAIIRSGRARGSVSRY